MRLYVDLNLITAKEKEKKQGEVGRRQRSCQLNHCLLTSGFHVKSSATYHLPIEQ